MDWQHADHPDPEISLEWSEDFWPPEEWYFMPDWAWGNTDPLWKFDNPESAKAVAAKMTKEQLYLFAVMQVVGDICNGGFSQAFYNSYSEIAEEAVLGLEMFGLTRHAEILDEGFTLFGIRPIPRDRNVRIAKLEALSTTEKDRFGVFGFLGFGKPAINPAGDVVERWELLQSELFKLLQADTHGDGYDAAFYRPIAEWIYERKDRFFII